MSTESGPPPSMLAKEAKVLSRDWSQLKAMPWKSPPSISLFNLDLLPFDILDAFLLPSVSAKFLKVTDVSSQ